MSEDFDYDYAEADDEKARYPSMGKVNFAIITSGIKRLPFYEDDVFLGMQAMNIGVSDYHITHLEYDLLETYIEIEKAPIDLALTVGALSQMWAYGAYEVLRMWRDRHFHFSKWYRNGAAPAKIKSLDDSTDELMNVTIETRKRQLERYMDDSEYRELIDFTWSKLEPAYRLIESYRINMAKHCAPGKGNVIPRAPGYGRINAWCGSLDYELIASDGTYDTFNRRDLAECLRTCVLKAQRGGAADALVRATDL